MFVDVADASKQVRFGADGGGVREMVMCTECAPAERPRKNFPPGELTELIDKEE